MYKFNSFTQKANEVLNLAITAAEDYGHNYVGSEHILLSITRDGTTPAAEILIDNGTAYDDLRQAVIELVGLGTPSILNHRYFTTATKRILDSSCTIARKEQKNQASPEHILAAIIREPSCSACTVIKKAGGSLSGICSGLEIIGSADVRGELLWREGF